MFEQVKKIVPGSSSGPEACRFCHRKEILMMSGFLEFPPLKA